VANEKELPSRRRSIRVTMGGQLRGGRQNHKYCVKRRKKNPWGWHQKMYRHNGLETSEAGLIGEVTYVSLSKVAALQMRRPDEILTCYESSREENTSSMGGKSITYKDWGSTGRSFTENAQASRGGVRAHRASYPY